MGDCYGKNYKEKKQLSYDRYNQKHKSNKDTLPPINKGNSQIKINHQKNELKNIYDYNRSTNKANSNSNYNYTNSNYNNNNYTNSNYNNKINSNYNKNSNGNYYISDNNKYYNNPNLNSFKQSSSMISNGSKRNENNITNLFGKMKDNRNPVKINNIQVFDFDKLNNQNSLKPISNNYNNANSIYNNSRINNQKTNNNEDKKSNISKRSKKHSNLDTKKLIEQKKNNNAQGENINKDILKNNNHKSIDKYKQEEKKQKIQQKYEIEAKDKEIIYINKKEPKGLYNLGLSCYMNSILQCLFYVRELRNYFIKNKNTFNNKPVSKALAEVMYGLLYDPKEYYEPIAFKKEMGNKNGLFSGFKAGDAKDLFFNLIDSIINELSTENDAQSSQNNTENIDFTNKFEVFKEAKKETDKNIINDLFIGYYQNKYKCIKNPKYIFSINTDSFILFDLEKISNYYENRILSLDDCFSYNFDRTYKTSFYCSICKKEENNNTNDMIFEPPKILVLILDRGKGKRFKGKVTFEDELDIKDYIDKDNYKINSKYKLIGVSTHSGTSSSSGHYTACCLTDNGDYYYFSDTYCHKIKDMNKLNENEPYLLFYQQKNT